MASVVALSPIFVSEGRGKLAIDLISMDTRLVPLHAAVYTWGCGYPAVYINYANYICAIVVLLAYSHKYRARINNRLYGIQTVACVSHVNDT